MQLFGWVLSTCMPTEKGAALKKNWNSFFSWYGLYVDMYYSVCFRVGEYLLSAIGIPTYCPDFACINRLVFSKPFSMCCSQFPIKFNSMGTPKLIIKLSVTVLEAGKTLMLMLPYDLFDIFVTDTPPKNSFCEANILIPEKNYLFSKDTQKWCYDSVVDNFPYQSVKTWYYQQHFTAKSLSFLSFSIWMAGPRCLLHPVS